MPATSVRQPARAKRAGHQQHRTRLREELTERSCEGSLRGNREDATPVVHPSGLSSAAHCGRGAGCAGLCEKSKESRGFLTPTPTCFKAEDDKAAAAGTEQLRIRVPPLALCRAGERNSRLRIGCGLWPAVAREWGDECRINGELSSVPEGQAIAHDLNPPDRHINVHVSDMNIARDSSAGFAADAGEGVLERKRPSRKDPGGGTGGSVVPQRVEASAAAACAGATKQQNPKLCAGDSDIVEGGGP